MCAGLPASSSLLCRGAMFESSSLWRAAARARRRCPPFPFQLLRRPVVRRWWCSEQTRPGTAQPRQQVSAHTAPVLTSRSTNQPTSQPSNHPTNQPANHPTFKPAVIQKSMTSDEYTPCQYMSHLSSITRFDYQTTSQSFQPTVQTTIKPTIRNNQTVKHGKVQ